MRMPSLLVLAILVCPAATATAQTSTPGHIPPEAVGNEADAKQLALAKQQGAAYLRAVAWERQGAPWSAETRAGDYRLTATLTPAEGGWFLAGGALSWREPQAGQAHLRVFAADGGDGRFVPGATMRARFLDASGAAVGGGPVPFGHYPLTDAYGADLVFPTGVAAIEVDIDPLPMRRHDPYNGDRFSTPATAVFAYSGSGLPTGSPASERAEHAPPELKAAMVGALDATVKAVWKQANAGAEKDVPEYKVDYAVEYGEAYWEFRGGRFRYAVENENSAVFNAHVEIVPRDPLTGGFLPDTNVTVRLTAPDGTGVEPPPLRGELGGPRTAGDVPLMWHSWLYHYGQNWRVGRAGAYRMDVRFTPPSAPRYGRETGNRMTVPAMLTFDGVTIKTGQK